MFWNIVISWIPRNLSFRYILFHEIRLQTMLWHHDARVNSHRRWKQTRFRVCFHLWCELTSATNVTDWQVSWNSWYVKIFGYWIFVLIFRGWSFLDIQFDILKPISIVRLMHNEWCRVCSRVIPSTLSTVAQPRGAAAPLEKVLPPSQNCQKTKSKN